MRDGRKIAALAFLTLLMTALMLFLFGSCVFVFTPEYPPFELEQCSDPKKYMEVNAYVQELFATKYTDFFPEELQDPENASYYYEYSFSDRELFLTIYLEQGFQSDTEFNRETGRIRAMTHSDDILCGDVEYIVFDMPSEERIADYMVEKEGYNAWDFTFSAVKADCAHRQITYLLSVEYDNNDKKDVVVSFIKTYLRDLRTASF